MIRRCLPFVFLILFSNQALAQTQFLFKQYFDGADTLSDDRLHIDSNSAKLWQIGPPQKTLFDTAATAPNVLVTDTVNFYPKNDTSSFIVGLNTAQVNWAVLAIRWSQKLDIDSALDGGIVEITIDSGATWVNIFNDQKVYNLYGFQTGNVDTLADSVIAFTGTDTVWRDIWLCYNYTTIQATDSIALKFTFRSDSVDNNKEGWMIDNMFVTRTWVHTVNDVDNNSLFLVYPTITNGIVRINTEESEIIDAITVTNLQGKVVMRKHCRENITEIDISKMPSGNYFISVFSGNKVEVHKVFLSQ